MMGHHDVQASSHCNQQLPHMPQSIHDNTPICSTVDTADDAPYTSSKPGNTLTSCGQAKNSKKQRLAKATIGLCDSATLGASGVFRVKQGAMTRLFLGHIQKLL